MGNPQPKYCWDVGPNEEVVLVEYLHMDTSGNPIPLYEPTLAYPDLDALEANPPTIMAR